MNIAVVTGASSGMGRVFAIELAKTQPLDEIWVIARREQRLKELQNLVSVPVRVLPYDLTVQENIEAYAALLAREKPNVAVLVNASGFGRFTLTTNVPLDVSLHMIDLNVKAIVSMCNVTLPYMTRGSRIINLGSLSSFQPVPYINVYGATKAFVLSYSRALNVELQPLGIRVIAVCPGWVKTEFFDHAVVDEDAVTYYNYMWEPEDVVAKALRDLSKGKDLSILGAPIRMQVLLTKLLPHKLVMRVWMKQQKHDKYPR